MDRPTATRYSHAMPLLDIPSLSAQQNGLPLTIESTLKDLLFHEHEVDVTHLGSQLFDIFEANSTLPGVVLRENGEFSGMLSRRRFFRILTRRYGQELFLKRPISLLYEYAQQQILILSENTKIIDAVQASLERSPELLYEPIVVRFEHEHEKILDVHHLLLAHAQIHALTTKLLHEQTQDKLIQTEKMASLGQMIAGVAHEILNPVNFICGNLEYLSDYIDGLLELVQAYDRQCSASESVRQLKEELEFEFIVQDLPQIVNSMKLGTERLEKIITALRSFSRMDENTKHPLDIHQCLDNTLLILNNRIKNFIVIEKNYGPLPAINCFSGQLGQVFTNLIGNAIDALTEFKETHTDPFWTPTITVTTQLLPRSPESTCDRVAIEFCDNGPGIPLDIQTKIFEIFFTTKPVGKGTGFGLAIARQIVEEKHGGQLKLASEPGQGTTFTVILPRT